MAEARENEDDHGAPGGAETIRAPAIRINPDDDENSMPNKPVFSLQTKLHAVRAGGEDPGDVRLASAKEYAGFRELEKMLGLPVAGL